MNEYEPEILILEDTDGVETHFEVMLETQYNTKTYVVLLPAIEQAEEYLILRKNIEGDYEGIADENELNAVFKKFLEEFNEQSDEKE
ncbi:MAG: DUF1292 domain-containing protein [Clostridiales bacterium]|jgi:uncharacterized protein YrzB (UPF0473 family)|nr:DUF1292 domain-containing protein [Clostridiales bacterium]